MLVPALRGAGIVDVRAGLRPRAPDDLPIVGRSRAVRGLVYATAHYRNGVLLAPLTAEIVRGLVLDRASSGPAALDPARCGNL
jgi:glycine oxidase